MKRFTAIAITLFAFFAGLISAHAELDDYHNYTIEHFVSDRFSNGNGTLWFTARVKGNPAGRYLVIKLAATTKSNTGGPSSSSYERGLRNITIVIDTTLRTSKSESTGIVYDYSYRVSEAYYTNKLE
jgi:hypothetical protein